MDYRVKMKAGLLKVFGERIRTWDDMYHLLEVQARVAVESGSPHVAFGAIFLQQSFLQAMRDMPEEGDITVLADRTAHILVYDMGHRMGITLTVAVDEDMDGYDNETDDPDVVKKAQNIYADLISSLGSTGKGKQDNS